MTHLTPELKQAIAQAGDEPVRLEDPVTEQCYIILKAEAYERIGAILGEGRRQRRHFWATS